MKFKKTVLANLVAFSLGVSGSALALEKGDWNLHLRAINVNPNDDSSVLFVDGAGVSGTGISVDSSNTLDISLGYMITDNWAIELLADFSSGHDVSVHGLSGLGIVDGTKVVESNVLPPTLFFQYQFNPKAKIRPYAGVGINYTLFFNEDLTPAAVSALGASNLDLDSSFGFAGQFGIDFAMKNDWSFNVDVKYIQIDTEASFNSALGPVAVDVDINPIVIGLGFGKTF
jgi:outer membrane protein